ncbi:MAG: polyphosphate kinase 1 [Bdellovibrionales bacterium]|nr:polyphosphate kinase 1 [Bdellovibrionales bacterium]
MAQKLGFLPTLPSLLAEPGTPFIHRDLSWLQFNERVLNEARDASNPLLERVKFLAISQSNLDEFFMIRFASLARSITTLAKSNPVKAERTAEIRDNILESVAEFTGRQADTLESLAYELENAGISVVRGANEGEPAFEVGERVFREQILPSLTLPMPFLYSQLLELDNLECAIVFKGDRWVRLPKSLPGVYLAPMAAVPGGPENGVFAFFLDDLIMTHLESTFEPIGILRLTKDGDISVDIDDEDPENIPDMIRSGIGRREKGKAVRLQYLGSFEDAFLTQCLNTLKLQPGQLIVSPGSLFFQSLWVLVNQCPEAILKARPNLKHAALEGRLPRIFEKSEEIYEYIRAEDILLHHPYDSFDAFVRFLQLSCGDPQVRAVEMTVYRMDTLSPVIDALKEAAKTKKVRVLIELRARFDELNNLRLADELKKAGVAVHFGFGKLKLHAKIVLVTREEAGPDGQPSETTYTHISTGNYNAATARLYTDLAVLTARREVGQDARAFFDAVAQEQVPSNFKHLVAAPTRLHRRLLSHIEQEAAAAKLGQKARIVAKVNALVDEEVVEKLYQASQAGVQIDLIVRGACSLIPGIQGLSENIRVISVVDRFLEHSRIYYFANARALYLCSADWMPRNFFSRLELAFKVVDPDVYKYLEEVLIPIYLSDAVKARELTPLGTWKKRTVASAKANFTPFLKNLFKGMPLRSQFFFEELARRQYAGTPLSERTESAKNETPES